MVIQDIRNYIDYGINLSGSLRINRIEQAKDLIIRTPFVSPEEHVQSLLGTTSRIAKNELYTFSDIVYLMKKEYPNLPYHFIINGRKFRVSLTHANKIYDISSISKIDTRDINCYGKIEIIRINDHLKEVIMYSKPTGIRRTEELLGKAFRLNKLLLVNGYDPVEFSWIREKGDILNMYSLDELSLSEIKHSPEGSIFERKGETFVMNGRALLNIKTGRKARFELGYVKA